ncbi:hypothetical protein N7455_009860 [Penicillium solitum]|uniref:uncharacterized protein n=1 Tax=Penicillium solitum TaxID=60172 RepID=UPI0032C4681B|nr:hypothetical protein N7455_009860 [Penicillium solitum]
MSKLFSLAIRSLRPRGLCFRVHAPVLRKMRMPLLHHNQPRRAFTLTALTSTDTDYDDANNRFLYEPLEEVERFENYRPGGYHPIQIGDHFHRRYRVVHKLGHGSYPTTWLACDKQSNKYVALKVYMVNSNPKEVDIISTLTRPHYSPVHHPGKTMVPSILDRFTIHGPNGNHACYVTATARVSLSGAKDARSLAAQLVLAVDYVHAKGIVHGDIHLGNILLKVPPNFDLLSLDKLYEKYGAPELEPVVCLDGNPDSKLPPRVPSHAITPIWLGEASEKITLAEARIFLIDFGEAFSPSKEARFEPKKPLSFSSDIWTLACTIWSIIAQRPLFEGFLATDDDMTCELVVTLGVLPPEWWKRWKARQNKFTEDGKPINRAYDYFRSWNDRFEDSVEKPRRDKGIPSFDAKERDAIFDMLQPMLSFRPEDRPTTKQILQSEWMVKWALPEYGKIQNNI